MIVNTPRGGGEIGEAFGCRAATIKATGMAVETIGRPIPNTALLAALITLTGNFELSALEAAVSKRFTGDILDRNLELVRKAAASVEVGAWKETADA